MFDVSFTELMLIGVVALVVIGPERLPKVARTIGHLVGRAQRYVGDVKKDIQREMDIEKFDDLKSEMQEAAKSVKSSLKEATDTIKNPLEEARKSVEQASESIESFAKDAHQEISTASSSSDSSKQPEQIKNSIDQQDKVSTPKVAPVPEQHSNPMSDTELADSRLKSAQQAKDNS